jgi:ABC-type Zn uptake system ZnuABC Zn-binding protein ZnuA
MMRPIPIREWFPIECGSIAPAGATTRPDPELSMPFTLHRLPRAGLVLVAAVAAGTVACSSTAPAGDATGGSGGPAKVRVVATTTQVQDFSRVIGGDCVEVHGVLQPNVDPHDYEPSPADLVAIAEADVIVKNGVDLEKWFDDTIASASPRGAIVDASDGVTVLPGDDEDPAGDPHIWHDPQNAKQMVATIESALASARPACAEELAANLARYSAELDALDAANRTAIDGLPNRKLVTNHDAFGYYVRHYGLDFVGSIIPSFDTSAELSAADIDDLVAQIQAQGVKAIFSEASLPPKTANAIGQEAGVKVVEGEDALYGDTLGPAGSDAATYLQMLAHNTRTIVDNLS